MSRGPVLVTVAACVAIGAIAGDRETAAKLIGWVFLMVCVGVTAKRAES